MAIRKDTLDSLLAGHDPQAVFAKDGAIRRAKERYLADAYDALGRYEDVVAAIQRMHDPSEGRRLQAIGCAHLGMMDGRR